MLALSVADATDGSITLTIALDTAGGSVRAVELRLTTPEGLEATLDGPGGLLGPDPLALAAPTGDGLLITLARRGQGGAAPEDSVAARVRLRLGPGAAGGTRAVRVEAIALDEALEPLGAIAPAGLEVRL